MRRVTFDSVPHRYPDSPLNRSFRDIFIARMRRLFVEGELVADAETPSYYMLQLLTSCGPDREFVGFLTADGLDYCGEGVVYRGILWLEHELREIGLIAEREHLKISPDGCTRDCRLDILRNSRHTDIIILQSVG